MAERPFRRERLTLHERVRPVLAMASACFRADPTRTVLSLVLRGAAATAPPLFAVALAVLVDSARPGVPVARAVLAVGLLASAVAANSILDEMGWKVVQVLEERTRHLVDLEIMRIVAGLPDLEHLENPERLDRIERIRDEHWLLAMSVEALVHMAVVLFQVALSVALLASIDGRLVVLPLFAVPSLLAGAKAERIRWRVLDEHASDFRRVEDFLRLATRPEHAKEMRVFGLGPEVVRRHRAVTDGIERWERAHRLQGAWLVSAGRAVFALGYVGAIAWVASRVASGAASVSELVLAVVLSGQVMNQLQGATGSTNWLAWTLTAVRRWLWLIDYAAGRPAQATTPLPVPDALRDGIRLEDVSFRYPGTERTVLEHVDLHLPAGSIVALVGENGAGKTTLAKLLCRFYEPTEGRIALDGVALSDLDVEAWRARAAAVFQDHARLEFVARDAVTIGDLPRLGHEPAALAALDRGASADLLDTLPEGLATQLGVQWAQGAELSGGEWQKVALGRGMMRETPLLLVLDEPTAALDAETEHRLFERYALMARLTAREAGTITLLVSHRFSTVRMADVIVVVADGRVVEHGSHAELVAAGGLYAELYGMQARAYR